MSNDPHARRWPWSLAVLLVLAAYGPSLARHAARMAEPAAFTDDVAQHVAPYLRYWDRALPREDYAGDYFIACHPIGYRALYTAWAHVADPRTLSKVLPYALLLAMLAALALAASRWGGAGAGAAVMLLALSSSLFFSRMIGGLPRGFAFPVFAGMMAAAVHGRLRWLAALTALAGATYPVIAVPGGLALGLIALLLPAGDRGEAADWSLARRAALVAGTGLAVAAIALPTLLAARPFGEQLRDEQEFPELQPGGRLLKPDRLSYAVPVQTWLRYALPTALGARGQPWCQAAVDWLRVADAGTGRRTRMDGLQLGLNLLALTGLVLLARRDAGMRRLLALLAAALIGYVLARLVSPRLFMPQRHVAYALPMLALLLCAVAPAALWPRRAGAAALLCAGPLLLLTGARVHEENGLDRRYAGVDSFIPAIAALPADCLVAGWPKLVDPVPYLAARRVLLSYETSLPYHRAYTLETRRRMEAFTRAYWATNAAPIVALRRDFGVTHLLVYRNHFAHPPMYYRPFSAPIRAATRHRRPEDYEVIRRLGAAIYRSEPYYLLDLRTPDAP